VKGALAIMCAAALVTPDDAADPAKMDRARMQGEWIAEAPRASPNEVRIEGDWYKARTDGEGFYVCVMRLDVTQNPKVAECYTVKSNDEQQQGTTSKSIYKFENDRIVFGMFTHKPDAPRTFEDAGIVVLSLRKVQR
jgi:uncharacterized protein (TIGR03067 family)